MAGFTWDSGYHDLAEGDADAVEAVDDGWELECVEARRNVANHSDALALEVENRVREGGREMNRWFELHNNNPGGGKRNEASEEKRICLPSPLLIRYWETSVEMTITTSVAAESVTVIRLASQALFSRNLRTFDLVA